LQVARRVPEQPLSDALFSMPVQAVAHLLGFADDALPQVDRWMRDFVACLSPLSTADQLQDASAAAGELMTRFEALVADARAPRHGSLLAAVLNGALADGQHCRARCSRTSWACCRRLATPRPACSATASSR
jgi:cytochrome P450